MKGNGATPPDPDRVRRQLRIIAEFWNEIDASDDLEPELREQLDSLRLKCSDAIYAEPPDLRTARRMMFLARRLLERYGQ